MPKVFWVHRMVPNLKDARNEYGMGLLLTLGYFFSIQYFTSYFLRFFTGYPPSLLHLNGKELSCF